MVVEMITKKLTIIVIASFILIACLISALLLFRIFNDTEIEDGEHIVIRAAILSQFSKPYYLTIDRDGNLISYRGRMSSLNIFEEFDPNDFLERAYRKRTFRIREQDFQYIMERTERLSELNYESNFDAVGLSNRIFALWIDEQKYLVDVFDVLTLYEYSCYTPPAELTEIVQKIIDLSPMISYMSDPSAYEPPFAWFEDFIDEIQHFRNPLVISGDVEVIELDLSDFVDPE